MATPYKKSTPKPPAESTLVLSPRSDKRTFDARPKPGNDRRHEDPRYQPSKHVDPVNPGLDPDPGE